jgi:hypothetical protein
MYAPDMQPPKPFRRVFVAGRLRAKTKKGNRPCAHGVHVGRPLGTEENDRFADKHEGDGFSWIWRTQATCSECGMTVDRSQFRRT